MLLAPIESSILFRVGSQEAHYPMLHHIMRRSDPTSKNWKSQSLKWNLLNALLGRATDFWAAWIADKLLIYDTAIKSCCYFHARVAMQESPAHPPHSLIIPPLNTPSLHVLRMCKNNSKQNAKSSHIHAILKRTVYATPPGDLCLYATLHKYSVVTSSILQEEQSGNSSNQGGKRGSDTDDWASGNWDRAGGRGGLYGWSSAVWCLDLSLYLS